MGPFTTTEAALGVVVRGGRVLVQPRRGDPVLSDVWEFPGGRRRPEESLEEAVVREVAEETGMAVDAGPLLVALSHRYPHRTVSLFAYLCRPIEDSPIRPGCEWVALSELRRRRLPAANTAILDALEWGLRRGAGWTRHEGGCERYEDEPTPLDEP